MFFITSIATFIRVCAFGMWGVFPRREENRHGKMPLTVNLFKTIHIFFLLELLLKNN